MDADTFREAVEEAKGTELDRLGSSKLLVALTDAELDRESVLRVAAHSEHAARETFRRWADSEDDAGAREAFDRVREQEADHYERVVASLGDDDFDPSDGGPMHMYLRGLEDTASRVAAGLVGRGLVSLRTHTQIVGFFVNEADERRADLFRDLKRETGEEVDLGLRLLEERCEADEDWERARAAAEYVIQIAYDDYADSLEGMGVNPRSVC
ncbi:ferritin family protein [Halegenticoccus soli]|uniref:rubrerythrin family protein n=1 Tax=Halegenticoccus soli TaxID=1985678 RepID=UPI000C6D1280|nr:rubrerythrin family protein [Halegenticoccus soli]